VLETGIDQVVNAAIRARIPLFCNRPYEIYGNILFALGAEYFEVGKIAGNMAADVLEGKSTDKIGIENVVPNKLMLNPEALKNLKDKWDISSFSNTEPAH
jgi:putative ABC transport system substrate-binding protein